MPFREDLLRLAHNHKELKTAAIKSRSDNWRDDQIAIIDPWDMINEPPDKIPVKFFNRAHLLNDEWLELNLGKVKDYLDMDEPKIKKTRRSLIRGALIKESVLTDWVFPWLLFIAAQGSALYIATDSYTKVVFWLWQIWD